MLQQVLTTLEKIAPLKFAESWDNVGLLAGDLAQQIKTVMLTIDLTAEVAVEAIEKKVDLVVAYHPPIFNGLKRLDFTSALGMAVTNGIAIYSPHTALDVASGGTNDVLADAVSMLQRQPIKLDPTKDSVQGIGRIGAVAKTTRQKLVEQVKAYFSVSHVLVAGPLDITVERVAVAAGAGGELVGQAIRLGAEVVVTGELRHHDAISATHRGATVVCLRHSVSERRALQPLMEKIRSHHPDLTLLLSQADQDPFYFA